MPPPGISLRPDWLTFLTLAAVALILFAGTRDLPDYRSDTDAPTAVPAAPGSALHVQDFAYIFNYARRAALHPGRSPYSLEEHRRFLTAWMGPHVTSALCFAYGPTTVLVLAPLFPLPTRWAWLAWNVVGTWAIACALRCSAVRNRRLLNLGRLAIIGPTAFYSLVLGQTALLTTGLLGLMVVLASAATPYAARAAAACLFVLTMKPPFAVVGGAALLAGARFRALVIAAIASLVALIAAIAWWSPDLVHDYRELVARYNLVEAPSLFRMGFHPEVMSNLRNVLLHTGRFDDAEASAVTWIPFAAGLAVPVLLAIARRTPIPVAIASAWTAMTYALFSPHLSPTEDLVLVVVMLWLWRYCGKTERLMLVGICVGAQFVGASTFALLVQTGLAPTFADALPVVVFAAKVVVAGIAARVLVNAA